MQNQSYSAETQNSDEETLVDDNIYQQLGDILYNEISIKTRKYKFTDYPNVFVGSEAVTWLKTKSGLASTDQQAIEVGNKMIELGIFYHCVKDHKLINGNYYYRFRRDDKQRGYVPEVDGALNKWEDILKDKYGDILNRGLI